MGSRAEGTPAGVIYKPAEVREVPCFDVLTLLFESRHSGAKEDTPLHVDADNPSRTVNKRQLRDLTRRTAHTLRHRFGIGSQPGRDDVVLTISTGHWMLPALFFGTIAAGAIFSASSPASTPAELARQIGQVSSRLLVCNKDTQPVAVAAAEMANLDPSRVLVLGDAPTLELFEAASHKPVALSLAHHAWPVITDRAALENSTICILFSSGTTGLPKGVRLSHQNVVAAASLTHDAARELYAVEKPDYQYRTLAHLPAAHIAGVQGYFINPFYWGGTTFWMDRFDFVRFLEYNRAFGITFFFSVPPVFLLIAKDPRVQDDHFAALDHATSGAAPLGRALQIEAMNRIRRSRRGRGSKGADDFFLSQVWGLSETTGCATLLPRGTRDLTGSVSKLVANVEARVVDGDGRDAAVGSEGEIWVRGPIVTKGYWQDDAANREAFSDGWFRTGDIGYVKDAMFYVVDRKKEMIKYKAMQVAPAELEAKLLEHPQILDAAVIGIPTDAETEVPRAYVVADKNKIPAEQIIRWVDDQVANHKRLRGGVVFLDAIPKSPAGKILRKVMREMAAKERKASKL